MDQICKKCGNTIREGSKFCPECGAKYEAEPVGKPKCAYCGAEMKETSKFCPVCGKSTAVASDQTASAQAVPVQEPKAPKCAYCGAEIKTTSKFCPHCGRTVAQSTAPMQNVAPPMPAAPNAAVEHIQQQAAQHGVKVATPINTPANTRQPYQQQGQSQYPPQYGAQYQPYPTAKRRTKPLAVLIPVISVVLVAAILFTGLIAPGWMKGSGAGKITPIYSDNSYVSLTLPDLNTESDCAYTVSSLAIQAQINAMLTEERFYRAVEKQESIETISELLEQNTEAWERVDILCSASYMMGTQLGKAEVNADYRSTAAIYSPRLTFDNPFVISASAAETGSVYRMDRFDDAKEWAEYITTITDHAKAGQKTAYLAKLLKTDVKRAQKAIEMSQAILRGEGESKAHNDSATLAALQATKTAGKVAGMVGATVASGGAAAAMSGGVLATGGYIASGVDTVMEVTDTTLQLTLGEDHKVTKTYQDTAAKVAPVVAVVSFANTVANPGAWEKGIDVVCNYRFIADTAVDAVNGKILGIECPPGDDAVRLMTMPVGENATPEDIEKAADALADMGFDREAAKAALTPAPEGAEPPAQEEPFSEIPDEVLDEKIENTSMTNEEWQEMFQEVYEEFLEEMAEKGYLEDDDELWAYDPFMPIEDFPEDGDELGFDDFSMWAKPDMPGEDWDDDDNNSSSVEEEEVEPQDEGEPNVSGGDISWEDEGEPAQPGDDEGFDNPENWAKPEKPFEDTPAATNPPVPSQSNDIALLNGSWGPQYDANGNIMSAGAADMLINTATDTYTFSVSNIETGEHFRADTGDTFVYDKSTGRLDFVKSNGTIEKTIYIEMIDRNTISIPAYGAKLQRNSN